MSSVDRLSAALAAVPRVTLATLPTPLEPGGRLPGAATLLVKRDDLSGLGLGGNKARKLEFLCGAAQAAGADTLVTVGAAQSNHARMTAAAATRLGMQAHLVLGAGDSATTGNQLLSELFGAHLHHQTTDDWDELSGALDALVARLTAAGRTPHRIPMGGSTGVGALGFVVAFAELMAQCDAAGIRPKAIVHASSTGGTHGGLLAGRAIWAAAGRPVPDVLAIGVAKARNDLTEDARRLSREALDLLGLDDVDVPPASIEVDDDWIGEAYAVPSPEGDAAVAEAARRGAWVLDRTYSGKAFAGLLGAARSGRFGAGDSVVFWHTGGHPAVFAAGGFARPTNHGSSEEVT